MRGTVYHVDDDEALRRATTRLLGACGFEVESFASAAEFLASTTAECAGCLLLDLRMPGASGLELQQALLERRILLPVIFLTGHADVPTSVYAMKLGASDVLQKPVREDVLLAALDRAVALDVEQRRVRALVVELERRYATLTPREREVLREVVAGQLNKQAAFALGIAERTVKLHRARVLQKMGSPSLADLVRMAERIGLGPS